MSTPIKTVVLDYIEDNLNEIIDTERHPGLSVDTDTIISEKCFLVDEPTSSVPNNQNGQKTFLLNVTVYIKDGDGQKAISNKGDEWEAAITKKLISEGPKQAYIHKIAEASEFSDKFYDTDTTGGIVCQFSVTYIHEHGDLYAV